MEESGSIRLIDAMPLAPDDLAGYFRSLPERDLARCWVACLVSAASEWEWNPVELGAFDAAVKVVAERLHGVKFGGLMARATVIDAAGGKPVEDARTMREIGAGVIEVQLDGAPEEAGSLAKKNPAVAGAFDRLAAAPVGAWIAIPAEVAKYRSVATALAGLHRRGKAMGLKAYRDGMGRTIVKKAK